MVAEAFQGAAPAGRPAEGGRYEVDHVNEIKADNPQANLQIVSSRVNRRRAAAMGLVARGDHHHDAKLASAVIPEIRARLAAGRESTRAIAADYDVTSAAISQIRRGSAWAWVR